MRALNEHDPIGTRVEFVQNGGKLVPKVTSRRAWRQGGNGPLVVTLVNMPGVYPAILCHVADAAELAAGQVVPRSMTKPVKPAKPPPKPTTQAAPTDPEHPWRTVRQTRAIQRRRRTGDAA